MRRAGIGGDGVGNRGIAVQSAGGIPFPISRYGIQRRRGERTKSTFSLMFNAPDEEETSTDSRQYPAHEMPIRRELGAAMMTFVHKTMQFIFANDEEDTVMRQVATEEYRQAVLKAASQKVEVSLAWHTLAVWTQEGRERIGYFSRALDCCRFEALAKKPETPKETWSFAHMQADCLFEIGRVHFHEGAPEAARKFLMEALPLAREADALQAKAGVADDRWKGELGSCFCNYRRVNERYWSRLMNPEMRQFIHETRFCLASV